MLAHVFDARAGFILIGLIEIDFDVFALAHVLDALPGPFRGLEVDLGVGEGEERAQVGGLPLKRLAG